MYKREEGGALLAYLDGHSRLLLTTRGPRVLEVLAQVLRIFLEMKTITCTFTRDGETVLTLVGRFPFSTAVGAFRVLGQIPEQLTPKQQAWIRGGMIDGESFTVFARNTAAAAGLALTITEEGEWEVLES